MKSIPHLLSVFAFYGLLVFYSNSAGAQSITPQRSAREAANSDSRFIDTCIQDNKDVMFLAQKALDRASDSRIKELAGEMITDHSSMLYAMEQLKAAGSGASSHNNVADDPGDAKRQAVITDEKLSRVSNADFNAEWVSGLLLMQQLKYDDLTRAKESVTNPQLKMAINDAIPLVRKYRNQLNILQKSLEKMTLQKKKEAAAKEKK